MMTEPRILNGIIVKGIAGFYYVKSGESVYRCKARGIFKQRELKLAVGDHVQMEVIPDNDDSLITEVFPRKNSFIRPFIANVDCFVIVTAVAKPAPVLSVIDRFLVMAEKAGTDIILCINKCDLAQQNGSRGHKAAEVLALLQEIYEPLYPVVLLDSQNGSGFEQLKPLLAGKTAALAGASGVGKSTILNHLIPEATAETGKISEKSGRGKHTTRHSELFPIDQNGETMIFDTPGFTSFDILEAEEEELQHFYPEFAGALGSCRYHNCKHLAEPECGVRQALQEGRIHPNRYESYCTQMELIRQSKQY